MEALLMQLATEQGCSEQPVQTAIYHDALAALAAYPDWLD